MVSVVLLRPEPEPVQFVSASQEAQIAAVRLADASARARRIIERPMQPAARDQARAALDDATRQIAILRRSL